MRIDQNAIITILLSGLMTFAAVAGQWKNTEWTEPLAEDGWFGPQEYNSSSNRVLVFRSGDSFENRLHVFYSDEGTFTVKNSGLTTLEYHARDENNDRWLQQTIGSGKQHEVQGSEAKVWFRTANE